MRLEQMELGYRRLEAKLDSVLRSIPLRPQQQPSLDPRESIERSMIPLHSQQQSSQGEHVTHFDYNVPSSLGTITTFQQPTGDSLSSASTDSQSPTNQFRPPEASNSYAAIPPAAGSSHMQVASNNTAVHATSVPAPDGLTQTMTGGPSPYRSIQHQSTPVSLPNYTFQGIGSFNILNSGEQSIGGHLDQGFPPSFPRTVPQNQGRNSLGGRANPVMMTPLKGGSLAAVPPKGQPPDSTGGLYR